MNASIGLRSSSACGGSSAFFGATKDQCCLYSAPAAIHRLSTSFCSGVSTFFIEGGGITSSSSLLKMRVTNSLSSGFPGTMAMLSDFAFPVADSLKSSRSFPFSVLSSGP